MGTLALRHFTPITTERPTEDCPRGEGIKKTISIIAEAIEVAPCFTSRAVINFGEKNGQMDGTIKGMTGGILDDC